MTVSDTRTLETDRSGQWIKDKLLEEGHTVETSLIIPDEQTEIKKELREGIENHNIDAILINGGTGIAKRDVTIEVVQALLEKELIGFGELFRYLSYELDIGSSALMSRATAGVASNTAIFALPGSTGAVKLAMEKLILPELGHILMELRK